MVIFGKIIHYKITKDKKCDEYKYFSKVEGKIDTLFKIKIPP